MPEFFHLFPNSEPKEERRPPYYPLPSPEEESSRLNWPTFTASGIKFDKGWLIAERLKRDDELRDVFEYWKRARNLPNPSMQSISEFLGWYDRMTRVPEGHFKRNPEYLKWRIQNWTTDEMGRPVRTEEGIKWSERGRYEIGGAPPRPFISDMEETTWQRTPGEVQAATKAQSEIYNMMMTPSSSIYRGQWKQPSAMEIEAQRQADIEDYRRRLRENIPPGVKEPEGYFGVVGGPRLYDSEAKERAEKISPDESAAAYAYFGEDVENLGSPISGLGQTTPGTILPGISLRESVEEVKKQGTTDIKKWGGVRTSIKEKTDGRELNFIARIERYPDQFVENILKGVNQNLAMAGDVAMEAGAPAGMGLLNPVVNDVVNRTVARMQAEPGRNMAGIFLEESWDAVKELPQAPFRSIYDYARWIARLPKEAGDMLYDDPIGFLNNAVQTAGIIFSAANIKTVLKAQYPRRLYGEYFSKGGERGGFGYRTSRSRNLPVKSPEEIIDADFMIQEPPGLPPPSQSGIPTGEYFDLKSRLQRPRALISGKELKLKGSFLSRGIKKAVPPESPKAVIKGGETAPDYGMRGTTLSEGQAPTKEKRKKKAKKVKK